MLRAGLLFAVALTALCVSQWPRASGASNDDLDQMWVIHYQPDEQGDEAYIDLLEQIPGGAHLVVAVSEPRHADHFRELAHGRPIDSVEISSRLTAWARDRYVLFRRNGHVVCAARPWYDLPAHHQGDARVADKLGGISRSLVLVHSPITPIGGDVIVTDDRVLIGELSLQEGMRRSHLMSADVLHEYEQLFGRRPVIVPTSRVGIARLHIDLIVGWAGNNTVLVADPTLAMEIGKDFSHPELGRFSHRRNVGVARGLDEVARHLSAAGYTVRRVPGMVSEPQAPSGVPTVISYTNCVVDGRRVLLPRYGIDALDQKAEAVWSSLGFECAPIRCRRAILGGGAVRCMTNRLH